jgi:hypothetical protein
MTDFNVSAGQLRSFAEYLHDQVVADLATVAVQAEQEGCNKSGFTGLLTPFQVAMDALNTVMGTVYDEARDHVYNVAEALSVTADNYQHVDHANAKNIYDAGPRGGRFGPQ